MYRPRQVCTALCRAGYFFPTHSLNMASKERMINPAAAEAAAMTKSLVEIRLDYPFTTRSQNRREERADLTSDTKMSSGIEAFAGQTCDRK
ncbi:hypothetical protein GW17_00012543 [Ensete ventricosum]|nr:hypothetical protein GW17_00012543 [Ensete ventricosum]